MATDLAGWLLEQIAEDERRARAARASTAHRDEPEGYAVWQVSEGGEGVYGEHVRLMSGAFEYLDDALGEHVVTWAPGRVLAECDAKRRIIGDIVPKVDQMDDQIAGEWGGGADYVGEDLLKLLALPYADRDGHREEWRL